MTINLDDNKIPFGLLSAEEQEHLMTWPHGLLLWKPETGGWFHMNIEGFSPNELDRKPVYRTIPAPKEPERETAWIAQDDLFGMFFTKCEYKATRHQESARGFAFRIEFDAATGDNPTIVKETFDDR